MLSNEGPDVKIMNRKMALCWDVAPSILVVTTLMNEIVSSSETSADIYHTTMLHSRRQPFSYSSL
jgi:hypothetical protein